MLLILFNAGNENNQVGLNPAENLGFFLLKFNISAFYHKHDVKWRLQLWWEMIIEKALDDDSSGVNALPRITPPSSFLLIKKERIDWGNVIGFFPRRTKCRIIFLGTFFSGFPPGEVFHVGRRFDAQLVICLQSC
jgi:hypothetical protein